MQCIEFLDYLIAHNKLPQSDSVILLKGKKSPVLFFSKLYLYCSAVIYQEMIDSHTSDLDCVALTLQTSFLGQSMVYWVRGIPELEAKSRARWLALLASYQGPHILCSYISTDEATSAHALVVSCDDVDVTVLTRLLTIQKSHVDARNLMILKQKIASHRGGLSIDELCMMIDYLSVAGAAGDILIKEWFDHIIKPDYSLFSVAQYLFSKSSAPFYHHWMKVSLEYPEQFWITFWSEQLWRAIHYIRFQQEKEVAQAKSIGFRLPFSYLQQDWKNYTVHELINAHDYLYQMDYQLKNGSTNLCFDLFFSKFFTGQFRSHLY